MGKNMNRLGDVLASRMNRAARANTAVALELGVINSDLSLTTDGLNGRIGRSDYLVDIRLTQDAYETSETTHTHSGGTHGGHESGSGSHTHDGGNHKHKLPSAFRKLKAGDRVLVAWIGNDPVVVAIVVSGDKTTK